MLMTREAKIDIIIVNLFQKMLWISDNNILLQIHNSLKLKNIETKERILGDLYEQSIKQRNIFWQMENEIELAKNKISEWYEIYFENNEMNNLLTL